MDEAAREEHIKTLAQIIQIWGAGCHQYEDDTLFHISSFKFPGNAAEVLNHSLLLWSIGRVNELKQTEHEKTVDFG